MKNNSFKKLFNIEYQPLIHLTLAEVSLKAQKMAGKLSISGVQPKLSVAFNKKKKELEVVGEGGEYILKPQVNTFLNLPQNEELCMTIAEHIGIEVPPHALIPLKDKSPAYIIKRFDRNNEQKLHQESFFQILSKKNHYHGSLEEIANKLSVISDQPGLDVQYLYERMIFFFIIGNGDAHMKNFSVVYRQDGTVRFSPAYDIVSSKLVIPDEEDFALSMNGKKNKITRNDFIVFASHFNIPKRIAEYFFQDKKSMIDDHIKNSSLTIKEKTTLRAIVNERLSRLEK